MFSEKVRVSPLKSFKYRIGSWGEASEDVHPLVQLIAKSRLLIGEMRPGRRGPPKSDVAQLAALVSYVRRQLSITAVREQARMLLERLQLLGDGSADAGRRRERAAAEEARAHRERQACLLDLLAPGPGHHSPWLWQAQLGSNYTNSSCEMLHFILASSC